MKKILSLVLVLCMMVFAVSALAEQTTETTDATAQQSAESGDSSALFAASGESGENGESGADTDSVMQLLGATKAEEIATVAADSVEQFYSAYTVTKMIMMGYEFDVTALVGEGASLGLALSAEGMTATDASTGETKVNPIESSELVDGVLNLVAEGQTIKMALTSDGNVLLTVAMDAENEISLLLAPQK